MNDDDSSLTVWQSIEILTRAILSMQKELGANQKITLKKGAELLPNSIYEAKLKLNNEISIATLPIIGYRMLNDELVIRNHITEEEVKIPRDFHYLKVVKFGYDNYKLMFCNSLGSEFFEYKKYDPLYSSISDEYKFVNLNSIKKIFNPNIREYVSHAPSFLIAEGDIEPGSQNYAADLFELANGSKGRKVGTLVDEFGYFDHEDRLNYCNYHSSAESNIYGQEEFKVKKINMDMSESDKFYLVAKPDSVLDLHPISNLDIF
ncbi:hypothetical protein [Wolbachia endosymbiont of Folsomia candida]|uniref:hypothetical protein n=1 Tax=Wolbachia endosymbiont of Folsomia candida TaxID=169402 RepID=UPI000AFA333D|nr:hypothetical protein [Wolbachia endosymbiont of Folsomia candida]APR99065.1 hypothetical protein ASM33_07755 [Wolbachia endosymbiont of Folsomia candida]